MSENSQTKIYTIEEVNKHNKEDDCWILIDGHIYDITKFQFLHPAGKNVLKNYNGKDASEIFRYFHLDQVKDKYKKLIIGQLETIPKPQIPIHEFPLADKEADGIPYGDTLDVQGWHSPYYTESHKEFRRVVRNWVKKNIVPYAHDWEEERKVPRSIYKEVCQIGFTSLIIGKPWDNDIFPQKKQIVCGMDLQGKIDSFYEFIMQDELTNQVGFVSTCGALFGSNAIGLPPINQFGNQKQKEKFLYPCIQGDKQCCLAITEPWVGSDVANLKTSAVLSECKKFYIVNGIKKWITGGMDGDFFTTAVRTGDEGMMGISLLMIEREMQGFQIRHMKQQGLWSSGTSLLTFDNVKVPVENLLGQENEGFKMIMINFNHERLYICMMNSGGQKALIKKVFEYTHKRKTFGKKLIEHPVIRQNISKMIRLQLNSQAILENCIYNFDHLKPRQKLQLLPSTLSLLKAHMSICSQEIFNCVAQIMGGVIYTREGQGKILETLYREIKSSAILGGSEEIMLDLGIKLSGRMMPSF